ncbi:30S ribosome-binding factor RbfA [Phycisphaerales bacterium AB-hyl4]|uniref:Ribosome-binding factor A n=1 Tax=Natronomicrosphaera hydrolytica TaxID=3242702 RepID=A0ABV4U0T3_9BACT
MSHRIAQIESTLKRVIADVLHRRISDPRIEGMISITRVKVSPDLHNAFVYVSVLPEAKQKTTLAGLRHASRHIHSFVKKGVALRAVPHLDFRLDESIKKQAGIYDAIRRAAERTGDIDDQPGESETETDTNPSPSPSNEERL